MLNLLGTFEIGAFVISSLSPFFWLIRPGPRKFSRGQVQEKMCRYGTNVLPSIHHEINSFQVWCRANRDVGLDDPGVYPGSTIRDARLPILVTGTIQ